MNDIFHASQSLFNILISGAKSHTEPLFKFYNILKVDDIFTYKLLTFYWKAKQAQLPKYLSKFLPELSEGANKYAIRHPRLQPPVHKHEYIKGTCRYQLAMLLNEISVSDNSLGQLKIATTNVQIMTLFGLKRIVKSCLVQNYSYYCAIPIVMFVSFMSTELFNKCDVNYVLQCKL